MEGGYQSLDILLRLFLLDCYINIAGWAVSAVAKTHKTYDLVGSIAYLTCCALSLYHSDLTVMNIVQVSHNKKSILYVSSRAAASCSGLFASVPICSTERSNAATLEWKSTTTHQSLSWSPLFFKSCGFSLCPVRPIWSTELLRQK